MNRAKNKVLNYTFAILLLSAYSITCKAQGIFVKNRVTYSISTHLKKTYLKINAGDVVQVTATGKIVLHGVTGSVGPDGVDGYNDRCMDPVFPFGALLYKVGDDDWVMADPDNPLTAGQAGYLKLMVNDKHPSGNRGRFLVKVTVKGTKANGGRQIVKRLAPRKAKDHIAPITHPGAAPEKAKNNIPSIAHSVVAPEKAKNNIAPTPHSAAAPEKAKNNIASTPHLGAAQEKAKNNIAPTPHSAAVPEKAKDNIAAIPHSTAGMLTLPQLQQLSGNSAKAAKGFLKSKHFRVDGESDDLANKYDFNNNDVTAYVIKYVKENQATFSTSSAYNYETIIASLHKYRYTPRELVTKAEGESKYANAGYSMSIVLSQLNSKPQYLFVVKKL